MSRSVEEWRGKTDDAMPPPRVRLRIFLAHDGMCHRTGRKIQPGEAWALDHVIALCNGGENVESNLAPILAEAHKAKTAEDVRVRAKCDRLAKRHLGIKTRKSVIPGSKDSQWKRTVSGQTIRRTK